jgi:hypothetical protein
VTPVDHSAYRSAQASYQLDMGTQSTRKRGGALLRERSGMTPELVVGFCESERGSKHTDLHPWLLV